MRLYKPQKSCQKLFIISLFFFSLSLLLLSTLSFHNVASKLRLGTTGYTSWFDLIDTKFDGGKIKIGLVNADDDLRREYDHMRGLVEAVDVYFEPVSKELKWEDFFPEWIDEDEKWSTPKCPTIPMPGLEEYRGLDVIVARVPCGGGGGGGGGKEGIRDVFRLQVNLVVANLVVANGWVNRKVDRAIYVVFVGSCGPMQEIFRCDDLLTHVGDYWVYKPEFRCLKHKVQMPVGSCQIAPPLWAGKEVWRRHSMSQSTLPNLNYTIDHQRVAYATVLHSSEGYVCGAIALAQSIKLTNSTKDLVLLHDSSISLKSLRGLRAAGWKTRLIQPIRSPFARKGSYNELNYSKLRIWQVLDYDKIIFIDADLIVLKNIDKFFLYPQLSASPNNKVLFNSGIMVIEPSRCTFEDLISKSFKLASYNGGDQGFLNEAFTWWHRLPSKLNSLKMFNGQRNENREIRSDIYTIHFLGLKPWTCYRDYDCNWDKLDRRIFASDSAHKRWWQVYDAMPKRLQQYCGLTKRMDARIKKQRARAKNANWPDGHWKIKVRDPRQYHLIE